MTKDEMLKERDRLSETYGQSGGRFKAGVLDNRYEDSKRDYLSGFNAALELVERERVKPLRDELFCTNRFLEHIIGKIDHGIVVDSAIADHIECNKKVLAQVEEWE